MTSRHSPQASTHRADTTSKPSRISLISWLAVGGTGPPPTPASFCLMASERKAAYRREKAYKEAQKAASADFEQKWLATGLAGGKRQKAPDRRELMRVYGPKVNARKRTGEGENQYHDRDVPTHNHDSGGSCAGNEGSNHGNDVGNNGC
ncbi:hypothetical protein FHL15_000222 [Xylaria flabelliformis]|uniref:Uncharacterized protein n=1 Tax=Xylaria flabelliformis TaxID=2512241 RepID=A0A553IFB1_9PEZI|nr:hypothetical protein FHL15_000222 [Xylaria flabelliformis]